MRSEEYKSCNRKKCPYYDYIVCPHKNDCDHSKESVWRISRKSFSTKEGK